MTTDNDAYREQVYEIIDTYRRLVIKAMAQRMLGGRAGAESWAREATVGLMTTRHHNAG